MMRVITLTAFIGSFFLGEAAAQIPIETGFFFGTTTYQGDLAEDHIEFKELNKAFGGFLRYHFNPRVKMRGNLIYGRISGSDLNAKEPGLKNRGWSFDSHIVEMVLLMEYHPFGRVRTNEVGLFWKQLSPYMASGLGVANFSPKVTEPGIFPSGRFPEIGAKTSTLTLPVIFGLQYDITEHWLITVEAGSRFTFNDYLDGVSQNGNPKKNDLFVFMGLSVSYFLGYEEVFNF